MSAPRRWIDDAGSATPLERDLLRSAASMDPPPNAQHDVWAALLTKIPPPAGPYGGGGAGGKAAAAAGKAALGAKVAGAAAVGGGLKVALLGAGGLAVLFAGYAGGRALRHPDVVATPPAIIASVTMGGDPPYPPAQPALTPTVAPPAANPLAPEAMAPQQPPTAAAIPPAAPAQPAVVPGTVEGQSSADDETHQVAEARQVLRGGDAAGALARLEQIRARFPGGRLAQERESLAIEALAKSGRRAEASARATAFLKAYPSSFYTERVQAFVQ